MRTLLIATLGVGLATAGAAEAQRMMQRGPGASFPQPGRGGFGMAGPRPGAGFNPGRPGGFNPGRPGGGFVPGKPGVGAVPGHPGGGFVPGTPGVGTVPGHPGGWTGGHGHGGSWNGNGAWSGGGTWNNHGQNGSWAWGKGRGGGGGYGYGRGRWQNRGGRWIGGWNAPGGWGGYTQPYAGWGLPSYWVQPGFAINDWSYYGLAQPPAGYGWSRYYDDAVLIDGRGSVYDAVGGIDWDGGYTDASSPNGGYAYDDRGYDGRYRRDSGLGGAAIGAVVGGAAGAALGGGVGSALIGAGVGGVAGYAIDKAEDRGRRGPPLRPAPGYGAPYGASYDVPGYAPPTQGGTWVSPNGTTTVTTNGGYNYYGGGGSTTTVVVQSAPVVTTTTTETIEDNVTWSRPVKKIVKRRWRAPTKTICRC